MRIFDAHLHIIDRRHPLVENQGFIPELFTCDDYLQRVEPFELCGGALVSGSFQAFDQSWLLAALKQLGAGFVGVTQLPHSVSNEELIQLDEAGVRALRFNLKRGGSEDICHLERLARRVHEVVGWHIELYVDSRELEGLYQQLVSLPSVSIDHLGLSKEGLPTLIKLVEKGVRVKATGFGRVDFDVAGVIAELYRTNPAALMFGTDLPSTRAPRPFLPEDISLIIETLGEKQANRVLFRNALQFYRPNNLRNTDIG